MTARHAKTSLLFLVAIAGCGEGPKYPQYETDQNKRVTLFHECLERIPSGPLATTFNDWSEVVGQCESAAYRQAQYCHTNCPPPPPIYAKETEK